MRGEASSLRRCGSMRKLGGTESASGWNAAGMSASVLVAVRPSGSRKVLVAAVCIDDRARSAVDCRVGIRSAAACRGILPHEVARRGGHGSDSGSSSESVCNGPGEGLAPSPLVRGIKTRVAWTKIMLFYGSTLHSAQLWGAVGIMFTDRVNVRLLTTSS